MRCETCQGSGYVSAEREQPRPCPTCGGCGIDHCCGGEQVQPETEDTAAAPDSPYGD